MFAKHLISSSESLYMQMIHANYINNNIPGSKRSALVHRPGFAELQTNSQRAAFCPAHRQTPREREETGPGREKNWSSHFAACWPSAGQGPEPPRVPRASLRAPTRGWISSPETPVPAPRAGAMQQAGMARLEKSFISLQCSSAPAPFQVPCSPARLIQPFYLSSYCLC